MVRDSFSLRLFHGLGKKTMHVVNNLGAAAVFLTLSFLKIFRPKQTREIIHQIFFIGARSSNIVMLVGLFTGMVLGLQLFYTLTKFGSEGVLGSVVALSLIRELGPVLTAIMITARAGSAMTAEIGILRISEQIGRPLYHEDRPSAVSRQPAYCSLDHQFPLTYGLF